MVTKVCIETSRDIGHRCIAHAVSQGLELVPMDECDVFISVLYERLLKEPDLRGRRCYNFHPGILPWYRGAGAYSWVLINGEFEAGVTLHEIDRDIDHGPVIDIQRFAITPQDTAGSLFARAEDLIFDMFVQWLPRLIAGDISTTEQVQGRIYYRKDLDRAKDLTRFVRAFTFEGKENAYYINRAGQKIYIEY